MHPPTRLVLAVAALAALVGSPVEGAELPRNYVAGSLVELNDNGAWSWFMDERVIVADGKLVVGSVRSLGELDTRHLPGWGNVEISVYDTRTGRADTVILHAHLDQDDHAGPALLELPDGRILAMYSKHARERKVYYRFSEPGDPLAWGELHVFETPGEDREFAGDNVTYANLFRMPDGRLYNFFRGVGHFPNYMYSDDDGASWTYGGQFLRGRGGYSPYLKYACAPDGTLHLIATEDHPRNYDNSIYHGFLRDGVIHYSDGQPVAKLGETDELLATWELTRVFQGDADNVAWTVDMELDDDGHPYIAFSVQKDGAGLPPRQGGMDHRYYYGRWDGSRWHVHEMAYAGTRLYPFEDDYTGLVALDPRDPDVAFISTDAHPVTGEPLISSADGQRRYELFRGRTSDGGASWQWQAITANSTVQNLRPIVPRWDDQRTALVWMRGPEYLHNNGNWTTGVAAMILPP